MREREGKRMGYPKRGGKKSISLPIFFYQVYTTRKNDVIQLTNEGGGAGNVGCQLTWDVR